MSSKKTSYPSSPLRLAAISNFTGGLNLRADALQLGPDESPDMMDVSVEIGGGFIQRQVVAPYLTAFPGVPVNLWSFQTPSISQVVGATDTAIYFSNGSTWTALSGVTIPTLPATVKPRAAVFNYNMYFVFGSALAPVRYTGSAVGSLTQTWNETEGTEGAADGNMPFARYICSHMGRVFIAYTTEDGTDHPNRIRWSHADFAEDWRQEDFIDIDIGRDGDYIVGICEFKDRLYIFKNNSVTALVGFGPQNFQVVTISQDLGAVSQESIIVTEVGQFFFSWPQGVYLDRGSGPYPIFDKLYPLVRDGLIPSAFRYQIALGFINKNLWVSVPYDGSSVNARTYVYNPWIWKNRYLRFLQGPWYPYSVPASSFATVYQPQGETLYLAGHATQPYVGQLEQNGATDNWGGGATNIDSYFRTRWMDLGQPSLLKRWRHPDIALRADSESSINVEVRRDYDPSIIYKHFQVSPTVVAFGMLWDDGSGTVGGKWDDGSGLLGGQWSSMPVLAEAIERGGSMGSGRAVQLSFFGPAGAEWGVDNVTFKYVPKRISG